MKHLGQVLHSVQSLVLSITISATVTVWAVWQPACHISEDITVDADNSDSDCVMLKNCDKPKMLWNCFVKLYQKQKKQKKCLFCQFCIPVSNFAQIIENSGRTCVRVSLRLRNYELRLIIVTVILTGWVLLWPEYGGRHIILVRISPILLQKVSVTAWDLWWPGYSGHYVILVETSQLKWSWAAVGDFDFKCLSTEWGGYVGHQVLWRECDLIMSYQSGLSLNVSHSSDHHPSTPS